MIDACEVNVMGAVANARVNHTPFLANASIAGVRAAT